MLFKTKKTQEGNTQQSALVEPASNTSSQADTQPKDVITKIKDTYATKYTLVDMNEDNNPESNEVGIRIGSNAPSYKVEGYHYYTDSSGGSSIDIMAHDPDPENYDFPKDGDVAIRKSIASIYTDFGLKKEQVAGYPSARNPVDVYVGRGLICTIEVVSDASIPNHASCGLIASYPDMAAKIKPFAEALPDTSDNTVFSNLSIEDSKISGYQRASLSEGDMRTVGGGVAMFYRKGTGAWKYFSITQVILPCSDYNTTDLQNAFNGDSCLTDNNHSSTVQ